MQEVLIQVKGRKAYWSDGSSVYNSCYIRLDNEGLSGYFEVPRFSYLGKSVGQRKIDHGSIRPECQTNAKPQ